MNSALEKLYDDLINEADKEPPEEITEAERAKRFLAEKQVTIEKLKEISLKKLEKDARQKEDARMRELERKRQAAIKKRINQEKKEKELTREVEENTMRFWKRDITGKPKETGVLYFGASKRRGDAWVPHGYGEYRVHGEILYDGQFSNGAMHGKGRLLLENGDIWDGQFWKARLQLLGDEFVRDAGGAAAVVAATHREGRYRLRLDNGTEKLLRLDSEIFRLLRHKPRVMTLDSITGCSAACRQLYDYDDDQAHPQTSAHRENYYYPDLWEGRERAKREKQAELDLETKRSQILARRQVERDEQAAANRAADVAKGMEDERLRQEELGRMDADAGEKNKGALEAAQAAAAAKKQKQRDLSRSPPRER